MLQTIKKGQTNDLVKAVQYMIDTAARRTAVAPMQRFAGATSPRESKDSSAALPEPAQERNGSGAWKRGRQFFCRF